MSSAYWLVGVRRAELVARDGKHFFDELEHRFYEKVSKDRRCPSPVWRVAAPKDIRPLQVKHGEEFTEFFYVNSALLKAAEAEAVPVNKLELVSGMPPNSEIFSVIPIPLEFLEP